MWWIWKNIKRLGDPDYVGMTQYRRYFTQCKPNYGRFPIANYEQTKLDSKQLELVAPKIVLSPDTILQAIEQNGANGVLPSRF